MAGHAIRERRKAVIREYFGKKTYYSCFEPVMSPTLGDGYRRRVQTVAFSEYASSLSCLLHLDLKIIQSTAFPHFKIAY